MSAPYGPPQPFRSYPPPPAQYSPYAQHSPYAPYPPAPPPPSPPPPPPNRGLRWALIAVLVAVLGVVGLVGASCVAFVSGAGSGTTPAAPAPLGPTDTPDRAQARIVAMAQRVATTSLPPGRTLGPMTTAVSECVDHPGAVTVYASAEVLGLPASATDRGVATVAANADRSAVRAGWKARGYVFDHYAPTLSSDDSDTVDFWRTPSASGDVPGSTAVLSVQYLEIGPPAREYLGAESECLWPTGVPPATPR